VLAKKTVKNQITLPEAIAARFSGVEYFDASTDGACIVLRPLQPSRADQARDRLAQLGIDKQDVTDAISWARETRNGVPLLPVRPGTRRITTKSVRKLREELP